MIKFLLNLLICLGLLAVTASAQSSSRNYCISKCFATWNCYGSDRESCEQTRTSCVADCASIADDVPRASGGGYGAIAFDKNTKAWGLSNESVSLTAAKISALNFCKIRGNNCEVVQTFSNTCVAIAQGLNSAVGWDTDNNVRQASLRAIKKCGPRCFLHKWHCF